MGTDRTTSKSMSLLIRVLFPLIIATVFIFAAVPKIIDPATFAKAIYQYHLAPAWSISLMAIYLPWIELVCALAFLFVPHWRPASGLLIAGMLFVFTAAVAISLYRGLNISCGCFGRAADQEVSMLKIAENTLLFVITLIVTGTEFIRMLRRP